MFHDPEVYERPDDFWPDRFLLNEFGTKAGIDNSDRRSNMAFGSGRRFCPGVHLANNSLVSDCSYLHVFRRHVLMNYWTGRC